MPLDPPDPTPRRIILPGESAKSPLIHYVARLVEDMEMPPKGKGDPLTRAEVALASHLRGRPFPADRRVVQRLGTFLMRRGFDPETVRATLRAAAAESTPRGSTGDPGAIPGTDG